MGAETRIFNRAFATARCRGASASESPEVTGLAQWSEGMVLVLTGAHGHDRIMKTQS